MNDTADSRSQVMLTVSIQLFGAFRQFGSDTVTVTVPKDARIAAVREAMETHYAGEDNALALLRASALATDYAVLDDDDRLPPGEMLSILPPVCGG